MVKISKKKRKSLFSILIKTAFRFIGSTIGIIKDEEIVDGTLPLSLYPAQYLDNSNIYSENDIPDLCVSNGEEDDIPMWMRVEHSPNLSRGKLRRRIYRNIKEKNHMLRLIKKAEVKASSYSLKLKSTEKDSEELYNLRQQYILSVTENRQINETLRDKTDEFNKIKLLNHIKEENIDKKIQPLNYSLINVKDNTLKIENKSIKTEEPVNILSNNNIIIETNDMVKPKRKSAVKKI